MSEDTFLVAVVNLAHTLGWLCSHHKQSVQLIRDKKGKVVDRRTNLVGDAGLPDLVLVHPVRGRLMFRELKGDLGPRGGGDGVSLRPEQVAWSMALDAVTARLRAYDRPDARANAAPIVSSGIWRPSMIESIAEDLGR